MVEIVINGCCVWRTEAPSQVYGETAIREAVDAVVYFKCIQSLPQEAFAVLELNGASKAIGPARIVTLGLLDSNQVHPREVFADAVKDRAASVILAHNHPSGTLEASAEDKALTKRLVKAGEILGVKVLDHLIVTDTGCLSFKQKGIL